MGAESGCCSGGTDEALKSEIEKFQRGGNTQGIKAFTDLTNQDTGKNSHQDTDSSLSIPKELLESVAAVAKQPVWKPSSERSGGDMSPTKSFMGMTPEGHMHSPEKTPSSVHGGSIHGSSSTRRTSFAAGGMNEKDSSYQRKTFEELVKKVESSPTKSPKNDKTLEGVKISGTTVLLVIKLSILFDQ